jgi:hypothetical protein
MKVYFMPPPPPFQRFPVANPASGTLSKGADSVPIPIPHPIASKTTLITRCYNTHREKTRNAAKFNNGHNCISILRM